MRRLAGYERRYQIWQNHSISAAIVRRAVETNSAVAIEDLTGIRDRTNKQPRNKTERRRSNSWAFYQLRQFLAYKCLRDGVNLITVNPAYTSQTCHSCLHIGDRSGKQFKCENCGFYGDADWNGSLMIAILGDSVSNPESRMRYANPFDLGCCYVRCVTPTKFVLLLLLTASNASYGRRPHPTS